VQAHPRAPDFSEVLLDEHVGTAALGCPVERSSTSTGW